MEHKNWPTMSNVPTETDKTWTIAKSSTSLTIKCNDKEVVNLVFDKEKFPKCLEKLSKSVQMIEFKSESWGDTATDSYQSHLGASGK